MKRAGREEQKKSKGKRSGKQRRRKGSRRTFLLLDAKWQVERWGMSDKVGTVCYKNLTGGDGEPIMGQEVRAAIDGEIKRLTSQVGMKSSPLAVVPPYSSFPSLPLPFLSLPCPSACLLTLPLPRLSPSSSFPFLDLPLLSSSPPVSHFVVSTGVQQRQEDPDPARGQASSAGAGAD